MSYTWSQFKVAVRSMLTERTPTDTGFSEAVATYVKAKIASDVMGDDKLYAIHENRFRSLRRRLIGFQTTVSDATLKSSVRVLISDATASEALFSQAAAYYVQAEIARDLAGDVASGDSYRKNYLQLRQKLLGFQSTISDATLRTDVRSLISDTTLGDSLFSQAAAYYVQAEIARELAGDVASGDSYRNSYLQLRLRLLGFNTALTDSALKSDVRSLVFDTTAGNALFVQAVTYFVKAEIAREVNRDQAMSESYRKSYSQLRIRLAGFNHTLGNGIRAEVNKLLPVDAERGNISVNFIDTLIVNAVADIQGLGVWVDALVMRAKDDLQGLRAWVDNTIARAKADLQGLAGLIDGHILQAKDDLQSLNARVDNEIRQGVIDLQHYIEAYRVGHESSFEESDVTQAGFASLVMLPDQAQIRDAWIVYDQFGNPEVHRDSAAAVDWSERQERMLGVKNDSAQIAIDPWCKTALCTPRLDFSCGISLLIKWDGLRLDFSDADTTPFDEGTVKAAALFVQAELAAEFGDSALSIRGFRSDYSILRSRLYVETRDRSAIKNTDSQRQQPGYRVSKNDKLP